MTPETYCTEQAAPPGSALHYSMRGTPGRPRSLVIALHALGSELARAAAASHDPTVCAARLHWWRGELERAQHGQAAHPVARALADGLCHGDIEVDTLYAWIEASEADAIGLRPPDMTSLLAHARRAGAPLARSVARVLLRAEGRADQTVDENPWLGPATDRLGAAGWLVAMLRDVGLDARRGRVYLPIDLMQSVGLPVAALLAAASARNDIDPTTRSPVEDTRFDGLARRLALAIDCLHAEGLDGIATGARRALRPLLAMAGIERALLAEIAHDPGAVLHGRIALTPIRMLWISWRSSRGN